MRHPAPTSLRAHSVSDSQTFSLCSSELLLLMKSNEYESGTALRSAHQVTGQTITVHLPYAQGPSGLRGATTPRLQWLKAHHQPEW